MAASPRLDDRRRDRREVGGADLGERLDPVDRLAGVGGLEQRASQALLHHDRRVGGGVDAAGDGRDTGDQRHRAANRQGIAG